MGKNLWIGIAFAVVLGGECLQASSQEAVLNNANSTLKALQTYYSSFKKSCKDARSALIKGDCKKQASTAYEEYKRRKNTSTDPIEDLKDYSISDRHEIRVDGAPISTWFLDTKSTGDYRYRHVGLDEVLNVYRNFRKDMDAFKSCIITGNSKNQGCDDHRPGQLYLQQVDQELNNLKIIMDAVKVKKQEFQRIIEENVTSMMDVFQNNPQIESFDKLHTQGKYMFSFSNRSYVYLNEKKKSASQSTSTKERSISIDTVDTARDSETSSVTSVDTVSSSLTERDIRIKLWDLLRPFKRNIEEAEERLYAYFSKQQMKDWVENAFKKSFDQLILPLLKTFRYPTGDTIQSSSFYTLDQKWLDKYYEVTNASIKVDQDYLNYFIDNISRFKGNSLLEHVLQNLDHETKFGLETLRKKGNRLTTTADETESRRLDKLGTLSPIKNPSILGGIEIRLLKHGFLREDEKSNPQTRGSNLYHIDSSDTVSVAIGKAQKIVDELNKYQTLVATTYQKLRILKGLDRSPD